MDRYEFLRQSGLRADALNVWVDDGWLTPSDLDGEWSLTDADVARMRLIRDLMADLGVNAEAVPIILDLIDQLHGVRRALLEVLVALRTQPSNVRKHVAAELRAARLNRSGYARLEEKRSGFESGSNQGQSR